MICWVGRSLEAGETTAAVEVIFAGRRRFPADLWLNCDLARFLEPLSRGDEAVRYYSIARALRPETAHALGHLLEARGESVEAIAVFRDLVRLRPDDGGNWRCYGRLLKERGDRPGSRDGAREGRRDPAPRNTAQAQRRQCSLHSRASPA